MLTPADYAGPAVPRTPGIVRIVRVLCRGARPRVDRHRSRPGRPRLVVPPRPAGDRPPGARRQRRARRRLAAPLGLADDGRRARHRRPARRAGARAVGAAGQRRPGRLVRGLRARARPARRPPGGGRPGDRRRRPARRARGRTGAGRRARSSTRPAPGPGPFVPHYPGVETFRGEQLHTVDYPGPEHFRGRRVLVVGGGASAVQLLGEIAPVTDTVWVTRRPPVWRTDDFDREAGPGRGGAGGGPGTPRPAAGQRRQRHRAGAPGAGARGGAARRLRAPADVRPDRARRGALVRRLVRAGRRDPVGHRLPPGGHPPRARCGCARGTAGSSSTAPPRVADPRVQLVGYGPSASTIGANRAGRAAAVAVARQLRAEAA